jgi:hypothetical protein
VRALRTRRANSTLASVVSRETVQTRVSPAVATSPLAALHAVSGTRVARSWCWGFDPLGNPSGRAPQVAVPAGNERHCNWPWLRRFATGIHVRSGISEHTTASLSLTPGPLLGHEVPLELCHRCQTRRLLLPQTQQGARTHPSLNVDRTPDPAGRRALPLLPRGAPGFPVRGEDVPLAESHRGSRKSDLGYPAEAISCGGGRPAATMQH